MVKICEYCQKEFKTSCKRQKCCCSSCATKNRYKNYKIQKELRTCELSECENTFSVYPNVKNKQRFCSRVCQCEWQKKAQLGELNGNFGKVHPNLFTHSKETREAMSKKIAESWTKPERLKKHLEFFERHRREDGTIDWITDEMRQNISNKNIERLMGNSENFAYANCKKGYYWNNKMKQDEFYHSSWELNRMIELDNDSNVTVWTKKHKIVIGYPHNGITKHYYPDFYIEYKDGRIRIEEIKGYVKPKDIEILKLKILYTKLYCKNNNLEYAIDFRKNKNKYKDIIEWEKTLK